MARVNEPFEGVIMYRRDYRERDLLVKILTDRRGPLMFFVRGAKRKGFKLASDILPFTYGSYVGILADEGLSYIVSAQETHHLTGDRRRFKPQRLRDLPARTGRPGL